MSNDKNQIQRNLTLKEWLAIVDEIDHLFPKGECKERGAAIVLMSKMLLILNILPKK